VWPGKSSAPANIGGGWKISYHPGPEGFICGDGDALGMIWREKKYPAKGNTRYIAVKKERSGKKYRFVSVCSRTSLGSPVEINGVTSQKVTMGVSRNEQYAGRQQTLEKSLTQLGKIDILQN